MDTQIARVREFLLNLQDSIIKALEHHHLTTRHQRGIEFERRVLGRRPDQDNGTILNHGQKRILL